ncbi:MAG: NAD+ synthase [Candidatus Zixiibacteriota bacterium]
MAKGADLTLDPLMTVGILTTFLCDEFAKKGYTNTVLGVSGGVDSALGVALAAHALGAEHVTGLALPARESDPQSLRDAKLVARTFGIRLLVQPIGSVIAAIYEDEPNVDRVRLGNAAARVRMIRLFDYSQTHHALVVGTSNKTELLLGYGTWYGDVACSLNPIGDLYKTQVRQLADFLGVPERIIAKPPSADLWPGQTDEGELGLSYDEADHLLFLMVDRDYSFDALVEAGFAPVLVRRVFDLVASSQFKRSLPSIAKIGMKTVGIDFHLARDWGR